jgi:putative sterol carrier protein
MEKILLKNLTERVANLINGQSPIGFNVKFDVSDHGFIHVDGRSAPMVVSNNDLDADTTFRINQENLTALLAGDLSAMMAYMQGKLVIDGDLAKAMSLARLFS